MGNVEVINHDIDIVYDEETTTFYIKDKKYQDNYPEDEFDIEKCNYPDNSCAILINS